MIFKFHPIAVKELEDAINYYTNLDQSLSLEFLEEFYSSITISASVEEIFSIL